MLIYINDQTSKSLAHRTPDIQTDAEGSSCICIKLKLCNYELFVFMIITCYVNIPQSMNKIYLHNAEQLVVNMKLVNSASGQT